MDIYDVTYLGTVKRCKYETLYTLPPTKGVLKSINIEVAASCSPQIIRVKYDEILLYCQKGPFAYLIYLGLSGHTVPNFTKVY
jgi:hypothetical protein